MNIGAGRGDPTRVEPEEGSRHAPTTNTGRQTRHPRSSFWISSFRPASGVAEIGFLSDGRAWTPVAFAGAARYPAGAMSSQVSTMAPASAPETTVP